MKIGIVSFCWRDCVRFRAVKKTPPRIAPQKAISITGELKYQACDKANCYPPTSVPLKWQLQILPLDLKRSPNAIRHN
jgi:hypothetical protein